MPCRVIPTYQYSYPKAMYWFCIRNTGTLRSSILMWQPESLTCTKPCIKGRKCLPALPGVLRAALQNKCVIPTLFLRIRGSSWLDKLSRKYVVPMKGLNCTAFPCIVSRVVSSFTSSSISFLSLPFSLIVNFPQDWLTLQEPNFVSKDFRHCPPSAVCSL